MRSAAPRRCCTRMAITGSTWRPVSVWTSHALTPGRSVQLYRGDLAVETDVGGVLERERLRARFLSLLAYLADERYRAGEYGACLDDAWCLLGHDPCREDAHRVVMRCYVRR